MTIILPLTVRSIDFFAVPGAENGTDVINGGRKSCQSDDLLGLEGYTKNTKRRYPHHQCPIPGSGDALSEKAPMLPLPLLKRRQDSGVKTQSRPMTENICSLILPRLGVFLVIFDGASFSVAWLLRPSLVLSLIITGILLFLLEFVNRKPFWGKFAQQMFWIIVQKKQHTNKSLFEETLFDIHQLNMHIITFALKQDPLQKKKYFRCTLQ